MYLIILILRKTAEGSDTLRLTPPEVFGLSNGINPENIAEALSPMKDSVVIGPPNQNRNRIGSPIKMLN
jgi:hypothetical protein